MLELIVVMALMAILTGIVGYHVGGEPARAQQLRAQAEVETIGKAIRMFESSARCWPSLNAAGQRNGIDVLLSGPRMPATNPWVGGSQFFTWARAARGDLLFHHLLANSPGGQTTQRYPTTGATCWRGPYLESAPLDPWGRPYVVNVIATHSSDATRYRRLFVLSAGPDGRWQTSADATLTQNVAGDDIGCLLWQR